MGCKSRPTGGPGQFCDFRYVEAMNDAGENIRILFRPKVRCRMTCSVGLATQTLARAAYPPAIHERRVAANREDFLQRQIEHLKRMLDIAEAMRCIEGRVFDARLGASGATTDLSRSLALLPMS